MGVDMHELVFHLYKETKEYQACNDKFEKDGWVPFLEKVRGHHEGVLSYDGESVQLGDLKLKIIEPTIAKATELPSTKENYFKGIIVDKGIYKQFLKPKHIDPYWTKGISRGWIKEEYCTMLVCLQKFLICEGKYEVTFLYHLRILLHFEGVPYIDFPHFLWLILNNMVWGFKSASKKPETSLYQHGLMKLLVFPELRKRDSSWKKFLIENFVHGTSKSIEGSVIGEHSKGSDEKKGDNRKKRHKFSNKIDHVVPRSPQSVSKLDKGRQQF
jgi:hypothetical protein